MGASKRRWHRVREPDRSAIRCAIASPRARSIPEPGRTTYVNPQNLPPDPYWTAAGQTYSFDNKWGEQRFYNGRLSLEWDPTEALSALFTLNGFSDKGQSQMPQLVGITPLNPINAVNPLVANSPQSPRRADAGSWGPCVNTSGGTPANVSGEVNLSNRLYDDLPRRRKEQQVLLAVAARRLQRHRRSDADVADELQPFRARSAARKRRNDLSGLRVEPGRQDRDVFQELRIAGSVSGKGSWVIGRQLRAHAHVGQLPADLRHLDCRTDTGDHRDATRSDESEQSAAHRHLCGVRQHRVPGVGHDHADRRIALHEPAARLPRLRLRWRRRHLVAHLSGDSDRAAERQRRSCDGRRRNRRWPRQMREHRTGPDVLPGRERLRGQAGPGQRLVAHRNQLDPDRHHAASTRT